MKLLDFSSELLHEILLFAVHSRGVKRAMRLNLVCKTFRQHMERALFESRLLDDHFTSGLHNALMPTASWQIRKDYGGVQFWHRYYVYRVQVETEQNGTDPRTGRYVEIRQIAEEFNRRTQVGLEQTIDALCWLGLEKWRYAFRDTDQKDVDPNLGLNLLSAAAYFNTMPLAEQLLAEGHSPVDDNDIFPSPIEIAAWTGNVGILKLFQNSLSSSKKILLHFDYDNGSLRSLRKTTGPESIKGAALRGDLDILGLVIHPPPLANRNSDFAGPPFGKVDRTTPQGRNLSLALRHCKNPETFKYLCSLLEIRTYSPEDTLALYAALGNLEMVRYLLDEGAQMQGVYNCNPLQIAAHYGHEDIVDLLIGRGIDINDSEAQARGTPLMAAASSGCMGMVRKLVDAGARIAEDEELGIAVQLEHTEMANYFMDLYSPHPENWSRHLLFAEEEGLESMAQLLRERGVIDQ